MDEELLDTKISFLKDLDTKSLIERLNKTEEELFEALKTEATYKSQNPDYLASYGSDCRAVDEILAALDPPPVDSEGKKTTVDQRKQWLLQQKKKNQFLAEAIARQHQVTFQNDINRVEVEKLKRRADGLRAVLALKTAQIEFLGEK